MTDRLRRVRWALAQWMERNHYGSQDIESILDNDPGTILEHFFDVSEEDFAGENVLVIGSGAGIAHTLDVGDGRVVGIDPLNTELTNAMADSNADLVAGVGEFLPFTDDSFTVVVSTNVLDHCADPSQVVEEVRRVLTEDGRFLLELNVFELPKPLRKGLTVVDLPHPHHFDADGVVRLVEEAGFEVTADKHQRPTDPDRNLKLRTATDGFRLRRYSLQATTA